MNIINLQDFENLVKQYAGMDPITEPLFVFGESHLDERLEVVKRLLGSKCWSITFDNEKPSADTPYCIYIKFIGGQDYSEAVLRNCIKIAKNLNKPVFCFIDNSEYEKVPSDILAGKTLYQLINK
jgi:hypothetical protein